MDEDKQQKAIARLMSILNHDDAFKEKGSALLAHIENVAAAEDVDEEDWEVCCRGVYAGLWLGALRASMEAANCPRDLQRGLLLGAVDEAFAHMDALLDKSEGGEPTPS